MPSCACTDAGLGYWATPVQLTRARPPSTPGEFCDELTCRAGRTEGPCKPTWTSAPRGGCRAECPPATTLQARPTGSSLTLSQTVADEVGQEREVPFDRDVQIGVFAGTNADRETLFLERRHVVGPQATVEVRVDREPTRAGVDPNLLLLDRTRDDNVIAVR